MHEIKDEHAAATTLAELGVVFTELQRSLRHYLRQRISDPYAVDDVLQALFVKATEAIQSQRAPSNLPGWLFAAARTTVIDYYRTLRHQHEALDDEMPMPANDDADAQLHQQLASCLRPLAEQLPEIYRVTLLATDFDGISMKAVAESQNLSLSAIKSRASRARMMLKEQVLACCEVELTNGLVSDYLAKSPKRCSSC